MKKTVFSLFLCFLVASFVFAQQVVNDKYARRQLESMVATRWGKFIPQWYYIAFHNKYRKGEDRRTMWQLLPTVAALSITEAQSDLEKEDSDLLYQQALWISANRTWESHYHLYFKPRFQQLNLEIDALLVRAQQAQVDPSVMEVVQLEQSRLNGQIDILRDGFLAPGESAAGMQEILDELIRLKGMIHNFLGHQQIMNTYTRP